MTTFVMVQPTKSGCPATGSKSLAGLQMPPTLPEAIDRDVAQELEPRPFPFEPIRRILENRLIHEGLIAPGDGIGMRH